MSSAGTRFVHVTGRFGGWERPAAWVPESQMGSGNVELDVAKTRREAGIRLVYTGYAGLVGARSVRHMSEKKPPGRGRRFADLLGLTKAGEPVPKTSPRFMAVMGVFFLSMGLAWLILELTRSPAGEADIFTSFLALSTW